jgi:hypothetical protein
MGPRDPRDEDPTGEEPSLEYDGTKTEQLDDSYRVRIATASEDESIEGSTPADPGSFVLPRPLDDDALDRPDKALADVPTMIDKTDGYSPCDTIIEAGPPKGFIDTKRNLKAR